MRKSTVLVGGLVLALMGGAEPAIKDRSVIGYWKFNDGYASADVSGYGGAVVVRGSYTTLKDVGGFLNSGYADITTKGETFTATLGDLAPVFNGTTTPYYTLVTRYRASAQIVPSSGDLQDAINDTVNWHFSAERYQPNGITGSSYKKMVVLDPRYRDGNMKWYKDDGTEDTSRPKELANNDAGGLVKVSSKSVIIGGSIETGGWFGSTYSFVGGFDETMVVNRMMTKRELTRLALTGETYIYAHANSPSFTAGKNWSSSEGTHVPVPGDLVGAAYIVENGQTLTQNATATFGGDVSKKISLTLGRAAAVSYTVGGETMIKTTVGNFTQGDGTAITFYDLRLNDGTIMACGTSLTATLLDVEAPSTKPFVLTAANDFALIVSEATTGTGVLVKKGNGKLTVSQWTGTAKLRIEEGFIKTARLDGYVGGTVQVATDSTVAFTGDDVLPTAENKMKIAIDGAKPTAKTAVMTVSSGVTAAMIEDTTAYEGGKVGLVTVENGTVYVEPCHPEDRGAVPVLMVE